MHVVMPACPLCWCVYMCLFPVEAGMREEVPFYCTTTLLLHTKPTVLEAGTLVGPLCTHLHTPQGMHSTTSPSREAWNLVLQNMAE